MAFYGDSLSRAQYDLIALDRFEKSLGTEAELTGLAWFDYRFHHPTYKTYQFAHFYSLAFREAYQKYVEFEVPEDIKGFSREDPLDNRPARGKTAKIPTPTMLWKARQTADQYGIEYSFFCNVGMRVAIEFRRSENAMFHDGRRGRLKMHPSLLYCNWVLETILKAWEEERKCRLILPQDLFYSASAFAEHEYQIEARQYILGQALSREKPEYALMTVVDKNIMSLGDLNGLVPEDVLRRLKKIL